MRTPALAIGQAIWYQNRHGFIACAVAILAMAVAYPFLFSFSRSPGAVVTSAIPLLVVFAFVLNSLLVVEEPGSLTSSFPRHRLVLPVRTHTLVIWPMVYGWIVAGSLWLATAGLIYRSSGFQTPLFLPALAMATLMVWLQALSWLPIPHSWVRDLLTIGILAALVALPVWLNYSELSSPALVAVMLVGYTAIAYPLGLAAVESDRRGEVWGIWPGRIDRKGHIASPERRPFRSAAEAQFWYEWRCHGLVLPCTVGLLLLIITLLLIQIALTARRPVTPIVFPILLMTLILMPIFMAGSGGPGIGRMAPMYGVNSRRFLGFVAIRPISSGGVVAAKFQMAIVSTLLAWAVVVVVGALWIVIVGSGLGLAAVAWASLQACANPKGLALMVLATMLLPALTCKQLTGGFACTLSGRRWIADSVVLAYLPLIAGLISAGYWLGTHPEALPQVLSILPYLVVCAAIFKGMIAIVTFWSAFHRGLIIWSTIATVLGIWLAMSACGFACAMLAPSTSSSPISRPIELLSILTFMPLSRFALSTLAFDWNRHR